MLRALLHVNVRVLVEGGLVFERARRHLVGGAALVAEVVAQESDDAKVPGRVLLIELAERAHLRGVAAVGGGVDDEDHVAFVGGEGFRLGGLEGDGGEVGEGLHIGVARGQSRARGRRAGLGGRLAVGAGGEEEGEEREGEKETAHRSEEIAAWKRGVQREAHASPDRARS